MHKFKIFSKLCAVHLTVGRTILKIFWTCAFRWREMLYNIWISYHIWHFCRKKWHSCRKKWHSCRKKLHFCRKKLHVCRKNYISAVKNDIYAVTNGISAVKIDISAVKNHISAVKNDISAVKNHISAIKNNISAVKSDIAVKSNISAVKGTSGVAIWGGVPPPPTGTPGEGFREGKLISRERFLERIFESLLKYNGFGKIKGKISGKKFRKST